MKKIIEFAEMSEQMGLSEKIVKALEKKYVTPDFAFATAFKLACCTPSDEIKEPMRSFMLKCLDLGYIYVMDPREPGVRALWREIILGERTPRFYKKASDEPFSELVFNEAEWEAASALTEEQLLRSIELFKTVPEREYEVLKLRYGLEGGVRMTLEDTGREIGCTREHARQLEARALRKLKARYCKNRNLVYALSLSESEALAEMNATRAVRAALRENPVVRDYERASEHLAALETAWGIDARPIVGTLDLSPRTVGCLKNANIMTVGQLTGMTFEELKAVKNIGLKGPNEVVEKLAELGLSLKASDETE